MNRADEFSGKGRSGIVLRPGPGRGRTIRVPAPFVRSGGRIKYDYSPIGVATALAVRHVDFVGGAVHRRLSGGAERLGIVDSACDAAVSQFHQELARSRELRHDVIHWTRKSHPNIAGRIDRNPVFTRGPLVAVRSTPRLHDFAGRIKLDYGRRRYTTYRSGRRTVFFRQRSWPLNNPYMIARVNGHTTNLGQNPILRQCLGPERINPVLGNGGLRPLRLNRTSTHGKDAIQ